MAHERDYENIHDIDELDDRELRDLVREQLAAHTALDVDDITVTASAGSVTLADIMTEKYIALFQNVETWSDYKRTCLPARTPFPSPIFGNKIPGRLYYGSGEEATNPNAPSSAEQLQHGGDVVSGAGINGFRNPNDPNPCP